MITNNKLNVLINAYAVAPNWGSEQGMGWNWVINIARYCKVYVITEGEWRVEIEEALKALPHSGNIHFYYNPVSDRVRRMCWNQGDWRFYYYYRKWQKKTLKIARGIVAQHHIDIIHQLNMVGFREPGYLWKINGIPFVWGPICRMENIPMTLLTGSSLKEKLIYTVKNILNRIQRQYSHRVRKAISKSSFVIAATKGTWDILADVHHCDNISYINETGVFLNGQGHRCSFMHEDLNILWVGRFMSSKKLDLALDIISILHDMDIHLSIAGTGSESEVAYYRHYADKLGIRDRVTWLGNIPNRQVHSLMAESDIFLFTSISEATSTVVPEAISFNLPIVCFNTCGFGPLVKDRVGETVEIINHRKAAVEFAEKIRFLSMHREKLREYSEACNKYKLELCWEKKTEKILKIYESSIAKGHGADSQNA